MQITMVSDNLRCDTYANPHRTNKSPRSNLRPEHTIAKFKKPHRKHSSKMRQRYRQHWACYSINSGPEIRLPGPASEMEMPPGNSMLKHKASEMDMLQETYYDHGTFALTSGRWPGKG